MLFIEFLYIEQYEFEKQEAEAEDGNNKNKFCKKMQSLLFFFVFSLCKHSLGIYFQNSSKILQFQLFVCHCFILNMNIR